jgi:hypothetical protein
LVGSSGSGSLGSFGLDGSVGFCGVADEPSSCSIGFGFDGCFRSFVGFVVEVETLPRLRLLIRLDIVFVPDSDPLPPRSDTRTNLLSLSRIRILLIVPIPKTLDLSIRGACSAI